MNENVTAESPIDKDDTIHDIIPTQEGGNQTTTLNKLISLCAPSASRLPTNRNALSVHFRFSSLLNEATIPGTVTVGVAIEDPLHGDI